jgi:hypothetical protein
VHAHLAEHDPERGARRLHDAWDRSLGPPPRPQAIEPDVETVILRAANAPYVDGGPLMRVAQSATDVVVGAHHSVLDGLGLLALLSLLTGSPIRSSVRGFTFPRTAPASCGAALRRVAESLFWPPARICSDRGIPQRKPGPLGAGRDARGDHLIASATNRVLGGTPQLVSALAAAIGDWNESRGCPTAPMVVAIGASLRPGDRPTLRDESAYVRIHIDSGSDGAIRAALQEATPEPPPPKVPAAVGTLLRPLSRRLGSTALVSNLGAVEGLASLSSLAFWPVAHGRSGVSLGAASVGEMTTLTLRARHADFSRGSAELLLASVAEHLGGTDSA